MSNKQKLILSIAILFLLIPATTAITYRIDTDSDYGFYRIRDIDTHTTPNFRNHTLTINQGDVVEWENYATPDERLTIVSEEGLWNSTNAVMRWNYQSFIHTFNSVGNFSVYLREYPRFKINVVVTGNGGGGGATAISTMYPSTPINWENGTGNITDAKSTAAQLVTSENPNLISYLTGFVIVVIVGIIFVWWMNQK